MSQRLPGQAALYRLLDAEEGRRRHTAARDVGAAAEASGRAKLAAQVGSTAGTNKGLTLDPSELAAAGLAGASGRALTLAGINAPGIARDGLQAGSDAAMQRMVAMPDDPLGMARWKQYVQDNRQQLGDSGTDFQAQNAAKAGLKNDIQARLDAVRHAYPDIDSSGFRLARTALDAALRHNNDAGALTSQVAGRTSLRSTAPLMPSRIPTWQRW
jgi:hypothetical protein